MNVTSTVKIRSDLFNRPINFTVIFLKMTMSVGSCCSLARDHIACENIRFSSLFAAGDVSRGGTSATQRQKFHTDDVNQCLDNKHDSHGAPNINLSTFICLLVSFDPVLVNCCVHLPTSSSKTQILLLVKTIFHKY